MAYTRRLEHPRIGVLVKRTGRKDFQIVPGKDSVSLYKAGLIIRELEPEARILDANGEPVQASGRFWLSCETIDPFHLAFDLF